MENKKLAIKNGKKIINNHDQEIFNWPIITKEDENEVLNVLRGGEKISGFDITLKFEEEYKIWQESKYALAHSSGTACLQSAMFGLKIGKGDEIIAPSVTYWASLLPVYSLGGTVIFADIDKKTLCIDPKDIERKISEKTKAIVVVHYCGHPVDMDEILKISKKYNISVIEDVSHAHGALYKNKKVGTFGDVSCASLMSGKSLVAGEGGMLTTNNLEIFERAIAWGFYRKNNEDIKTGYLKNSLHLPLGGYKYRINQMCSALGRVQLRHYDKRMSKIQKGMNYFWDGISKYPGIIEHRVDKESGSTMGGWYSPHGIYDMEELGGLSINTFCKALRAEGIKDCFPGVNKPLHQHSLFQTIDVYNHGKPTRIANSNRDVRIEDSNLDISNNICNTTFSIPWFKHYDKKIIDKYIYAFEKVCDQYEALLEIDVNNKKDNGSWGLTKI